MSKVKMVLMAAVMAVAIAVGLKLAKYKPKYPKGGCFILHPVNEKGEPFPPSALLIKGANDKGEYDMVMWLAMVVPREISMNVEQVDKDLVEMNAEQVDCNTGKPITEGSAPTPSPSPGPTPEIKGE